MKFVLVNYEFTPTWLFEYTDDYLIYDRSKDDTWLKDFDQSKIIKHPNIGHVDYSKLSYLIDFYDELPEVFLWSKANLIPRHITKEEFDLVKDNTDFTPLLTAHHKVYNDQEGPVCYYNEGMYYERNNSWYLYANLPNQEEPPKFLTWQEWANEFLLPSPHYLPFPPGANFILTRERVHRYAKDFYIKMRAMLSYTAVPGESQLTERSYFLLWK